MINKIQNLKYAYNISKATDEEFQELMKDFKKSEKINCIICNKNMAKMLHTGLLGNNIITINNSVHDEVIFINHRF